MSYEIKSYSEDFLEKQVEIGTEVMDKWLFGGQTNLENLKQAYSVENFDPSTRFYAFKGSEMIGFLTSAVQEEKEDQPVTASLSFPVVLEEHRGKVEKILLEEAYSTLKGKGVEKVQTRASSKWGNTMELANEYGYKEQTIQSIGSRVSVDKLSFEGDETIKLMDYESERDDEAVLSMYIDKLGLPEEQIKNQLEYIKNNKELILCWKLAKDGEEVIASSLSLKFENDHSQAQFTIPYARENKEAYVMTLFAHHLKAAKENDVKEVNLFIPTNRMEEKDFYKNLGFKFSSIKMFEKDLD